MTKIRKVKGAPGFYEVTIKGKTFRHVGLSNAKAQVAAYKRVKAKRARRRRGR